MRPRYPRLIAVAFLLVAGVVVLSAYLRLAASGLSCADWPACYGQLVRTAAGELAPARAVPGWATAAHRLTASALGLCVLGIVFAALHRRRRAGVVAALALLGLTVFLAVLGYRTPAPLTPWVTSANLLGGMAMLAILWWLGRRAHAPPAPDPATARLRPWALAALALVGAQIALGSWVSANYAAPACPALPRCGADWSLARLGEAFELGRTLAVTADGRVAAPTSAASIHMLHRLGAVLVFCYLAALALCARRYARVRPAAITVLALVLTQVLLGLAAVRFALPLAVVVGHNATAAALLVAVVELNRRLIPATGGVSEAPGIICIKEAD